MNTEKIINQVYMNSGSELGCGHKISKGLRFRDDFELQLGMRKNTVQNAPCHRQLMLSKEP